MTRPAIDVIDASAFLCLIFSEPGFDKVEAVMSGAVMSAVNCAEVVGKFVDRGLDAAEMTADLDRLDVDIVPIDRRLAEIAGRLRAQTRSAGLALGARCRLALAQHLGAPAITTDKAWVPLGQALGIRIELAR